jgi:L-arabinose isomerase
VVATGDGVAVDVAEGTAVDIDAVDDLADSEQATSDNVIMTTSSVVLQRITLDLCAAPCVDRERVKFTGRILLLRCE